MFNRFFKYLITNRESDIIIIVFRRKYGSEARHCPEGKISSKVKPFSDQQPFSPLVPNLHSFE